MIIEIGLIQNFLLALGLVVVFATILYIILVVLHSHHKESDVLDAQDPNADEKEIQRGYKKVIKHANKHAKFLLSETASVASEMISGTRRTNEKIEENLDHVLQNIASRDISSMKQVTDQYEKEYAEKLQHMNQELTAATGSIAQNIERAYNAKLETFTNDLLKSGLATQNVVDKRTAELLSAVEGEIAEYKKSQLEKVEGDVKIIVEKVYKDVLRMSIPQNIQEELIIKSLEEAKRDGIFKL